MQSDSSIVMLTVGGITLPYANWLLIQVLKRTHPWVKPWVVPLLVIALAVAEVEAYCASVQRIAFFYRFAYYIFLTVLSFQMHSTNKLNGTVPEKTDGAGTAPVSPSPAPQNVIDPEQL